jgi:hypothetical protein
MSRARKLIAFGTTFSVALGIGFVMQNGSALAARFGGDRPAPVAAPAPAQVAVAGPGAATQTPQAAEEVPVVVIQAGVTRPVPAPEAPEAPEVQLATFEADPVPEAVPVPAPETAPQVADTMECLPSMVASPAPGAMVNLVLSAPCHATAEVTIHHSGMIFTVLTDAAGSAQVSVPALATDAVFLADFGNNIGAAAMVMVPEASEYDRAVLQWQGPEGMHINALEFGAAYGDAGHVWAEAPRDPAFGATGNGGFLTVLGDATLPAPMRAEVYSYPAGASIGSGSVDLNVEARVLEGNCGQMISAQSLQIVAGQDPFALDLTMTLPACDSVGEILVLSNMLKDLTLASR